MKQKSSALVVLCFFISAPLLADRSLAAPVPSADSEATTEGRMRDGELDEIPDSSRAALRALLERANPGTEIRLADVNRAPAVVGPPIYAEAQEINPYDDSAVDVTATSSSAALTASENETENAKVREEEPSRKKANSRKQEENGKILPPAQASPEPEEESGFSDHDVIADPN